jgi:hypothetical protein
MKKVWTQGSEKSLESSSRRRISEHVEHKEDSDRPESCFRKDIRPLKVC